MLSVFLLSLFPVLSLHFRVSPVNKWLSLLAASTYCNKLNHANWETAICLKKLEEVSFPLQSLLLGFVSAFLVLLSVQLFKLDSDFISSEAGIWSLCYNAVV